jgi:hypothetical protein
METYAQAEPEINYYVTKNGVIIQALQSGF